MSDALKNVIVVGGSGNVGREILAALLASKSDFETIATLKRKDAPTSHIVKGFQAKGVKVLEADYKDKASLVEAFKGADVIVSTVNVPAFNDQYLFVEAAIEAKVKRFIPSEFGSNTNIADVASIEYLQPKVKLARFIEEKAEEGLIDYTLIATGGFPEYAIKTEFYGLDYEKQTFNCIGSGTELCTFTSLPDVGKYVVAILKRPALTRNAEIYVSSFDTDYLSIMATIESVTGKKVTVVHESPEEQVGRGVPGPLVEMRRMLLDGRGVLARGGYELWNDKFPEVKTNTLEEVVRAAVKEIEARPS